MPSMKGKDILIIDDDADVRVLAKKILEGDGARVSEADGCEVGLALARKKSPQLIILDLMMPGKTGFDFLTARKDDPGLKAIPVIILSGKKDKASISQAIALGASDYFLKPLRATSLLQKARKALRLTSFLSKKFLPNECPKAVFSLTADIVKINEGGCRIEAPVRLGTDDKVQVSGQVLEKLGIQTLLMKVSSHQGIYASPGRYFNEISFVGMNAERAKMVRTLIGEIK
jgi:CheY-like chemotaxis protein